ncbi:hypothetical protein [Dyella flagellata]|uniref:LysM domain-containing protein n=1 Tax=Dyella flagellata TaxID=1867833 RepID=A0ABQ5X856_9GAMM|nr:hypothetical protein [Dyella flagellata]GLQ87832.1 hypothetical protein GCM10007898_14000 [Dyella flagellata]
MSDSLLQAIIGGNPLDLPGLGSSDGGLTILFPLSLGGTVNDLANALHLPVDSILAVNPGLEANSSLNLSQVVALPEGHIDQILQSVNLAGNQAYVAQPPASPTDAASASSIPPGAEFDYMPNDGVTVVVPIPRSIAVALDVLDLSQRNAPFALPLEENQGRWVMSVNPVMPAPGSGNTVDTSITVVLAAPVSNMSVDASRSFDTPAAVMPVSEPLPSTTSNQASASTSVPTTTSATTTVPPTWSVEPSKVIAVTSSQHESESEGAFSFTRSANGVMPVGQDRLRNPGSGMAPPPPMDDSRFAAPVARMLQGSSGTAIVLPASAMNAAGLPIDGHPMSLQLMAVLLAQAGGSGTGTATSSPFVDPQALAALAASQRATKVVDLGAGRSMQFSLVRDRLQRIDPIGHEQRAASRRTGEGLQELCVGRPGGEEMEQTEEQREQGRRRRAAIAAMRRRRRPRSRRCRYWQGSRRDLRPAAAVSYPKRVDFAEFRRRQLPRYLWKVGGGD